MFPANIKNEIMVKAEIIVETNSPHCVVVERPNIIIQVACLN